MALPNITTLTLAELEQLMQAAAQVIRQKQQEQQTEKEAAQVEIALAKAKLDTLIGPDNPTVPTLNSYTEIQKFTDTQIQGNLVLAVRKVLEGAELQARIMRDVVVALSR